MCINPITINTAKNKYHIAYTQMVSCKKCPECLAVRRAGMAFQLQQENKRAQSSAFLTLTYNEENVPISPNGYQTLNTKDWQLFMKRLRKDKNPNLKYFTAGEYGDKFQRPHFHSILFNLSPEKTEIDYLEEKWDNGSISIGDVTDYSILYTTKYLMKGSWNEQKLDTDDDRLREKYYSSKGLGENFLTPQMRKHIENKDLTSINMQGNEMKIPDYYLKRIYSENKLKAIRKNQQNEKEDRFPTEHQRVQYTKFKTEQWERKQIDKNY